VTVFAPAETKIKAENQLVDMTVTVKGSSQNVSGIDLENVTIGDVFFSAINYGETTIEKTTSRVGSVNVHVESAYAVWTALGAEVSVALPILYDMTMTVKKEQTNVMYFDSQAFNTLTKKKAK
jgi:hypothetical protein